MKEIKIDDANNLVAFNSSLIEKMKNSKGPIDINYLTILLLDQKTDKSVLQNILNDKKNIWDKGNWSQKIWEVIRENKLIVNEGKNSKVDDRGEKTYDVRQYLEDKIAKGEIGLNPI